MRKVWKSSKGFTLVEMIVIVGLIGVVFGGIIMLINPAAQLAKGRDSQRKSELKTYQQALELYRADNSLYPPFGSGYGTWYASSLQINAVNNITYLRSLPEDPGGNSDRCDGDYIYSGNTSVYTIFTSLENESDKDAADIKPAPASCPGCSTSQDTASIVHAGGPCSGKRFNYWVNSP